MYSIRRDIITVFLFLNVKTVMFFLCTAEHYSIINPVLLHKFKGYNKENGKPDESLGRKATGPVKWQPVAEIVGTVCLAVFFCFETT